MFYNNSQMPHLWCCLHLFSSCPVTIVTGNPVSLYRFLMICPLLYNLVVDRMSSSYVFPVGWWCETLCRCDSPLSVLSGRMSWISGFGTTTLTWHTDICCMVSAHQFIHFVENLLLFFVLCLSLNCMTKECSASKNIFVSK